MIVQDVTALPTFNPHGGPITHSSTGSKPDSPVYPLFPNLFIARGLVCNSRTTVLLIYTGIRHNTYSDCFEPLSHFVSGFERLPTCLKLLMVLSYLLSAFSYDLVRELLSATFPDDIDQIVNLAEVRSSRIPPYSVVSTMEFPKKGRQLYHDDLKQQNEDINVMDQPLREEQPRPRTLPGIS